MAVSVPFLTASGALKDRDVDPDVFAKRTRRVLLKEMVLMTEARRRTGTHATRNRAKIKGTTAKIYRQKGTGGARHGSRKANIFRGGGVAHGPSPRDYGYHLPARARRVALRSALRAKLDDAEFRVVEKFDFQKPSTRNFVGLLQQLEVSGSFLVIPAEHAESVRRSCRNIPRSAYCVVDDLNAYDVLRQQMLIFDEAALRKLEERYGDG